MVYGMNKLFLFCFATVPMYGMQRTNVLSLATQRQKAIELWEKQERAVKKRLEKICEHWKIQPIALETTTEGPLACASRFYDEQLGLLRSKITINLIDLYTYSPKARLFILAHEVAHIYKQHLHKDSQHALQLHELEEQFKTLEDIYFASQTESNLAAVHQLRNTITQCKLKRYQQCRADEYEADHVSVNSFHCKTGALQLLARTTKSTQQTTPSSQTFLGFGHQLFQTHPTNEQRRKALLYRSKQTVQNFTDSQLALIARLFHDYRYNKHTLNLTAQEEVVFASLPTNIQKKILSEFGSVEPRRLEYKQESK